MRTFKESNSVARWEDRGGVYLDYIEARNMYNIYQDLLNETTKTKEPSDEASTFLLLSY